MTQDERDRILSELIEKSYENDFDFGCPRVVYLNDAIEIVTKEDKNE